MKKPSEDTSFERLADWSEEAAEQEPIRAPSTLKARIYSAMIDHQQRAGQLRPLAETKADGWGLCVFEDTARLASGRSEAQSFQYCKICHARVLAERFEAPPIWWPHCPYAEFQNE